MSFQGAWGLFSALFTGVGPSRPSRGCRAVWQRLITNTKAPFSSEASRLEYVQQPAEGGLRGIRKLPPKARPSFAAQCPCSPSSQVPSPKEPPEGAPPHHHRSSRQRTGFPHPGGYCPGQGGLPAAPSRFTQNWTTECCCLGQGCSHAP